MNTMNILATDPRIWRVAPGDEPLARGSSAGPLAGHSVAVKDLFAVAGQRVGAGHPDWLANAAVESDHAAAVAALLAAGANVIGIATTDELAFSLMGSNIHYGAPPNPAAPGHIVGGSSSGPASAVASGLADIGLGTDTAGSIRVPASYCGLYGLRTTHDAIDRSGLVSLAPSFDTVGLLTRRATELAAAGQALLAPASSARTDEFLVATALLDLATPDTRRRVEAALTALATRAGAHIQSVDLELRTLANWVAAFRTAQTAEAWREHGEFVTRYGATMEPAIAGRFRSGANVSPAAERSARAVLREASSELAAYVSPGVVLALPTTPTPAPSITASTATIDEIRAATVQLTCLASIAGLPAVTMPAPAAGDLPVGLCLIGGAHTDLSLVALATLEPDQGDAGIAR
jgi:Asp-tRNA(Asn)/Glu-tRNA(Gln) amidotransferase A subunit family amidase